MPIMEWQETYRIHIKDLDDHHQHLVGLLNTTYDNFVRGVSSTEIASVLSALGEYADFHFEAEEQWMQANSYPHLDKHVSEHGVFETSVAQMHRDHGAGKETTLEVLTFLVDWLSKHILITDADLGRFSRLNM